MNLLFKTDIFCTKRCLATVSNNSVTMVCTPLLFACYQKWPTGSARTHPDVSV